MGNLLSALILCAILLVAAVSTALRRRGYRSLKHIRGPSSPSWLFGHEYMITLQQEVGQFDFAWVREYGPTWRIGGHLGSDILMTADPKAIQHIFHTSGYNYPKRTDVDEVAKLFGGSRGIVAVGTEAHQRQRKIMSPAFNATQLRSFLTLFQDVGAKMCEKWKAEVLEKPGKTFFVNRWLAKATLDIIGKAAFDYDYGALEGTGSELFHAYHDLFADSLMYSTKWDVAYRLSWNYLPTPLLKFIQYTPKRSYTRSRQTTKIFSQTAAKLLEEKRRQNAFSEDERPKDILTILERANNAESPKARLSDEEMLSQMQTLTLAGHETTASTLSWLLYELAHKPKFQARVRDEIRAARAQVSARGDSRFNMDDLDGMTTVVNAIKETLRFHPIVPNLYRMAAKDDVIPLSHPVTSTTGQMIDNIPVRAGQWVTFSFSVYNRLPDVWGEDSEEWNPDRFLNIDPAKQVRVGTIANVMTFSAGIRGCLGWRFSMIELQALVAEVLEHFEFGVPEENYEIIRAPAGVMVPLVRGKYELGAVMPLSVSMVQA